MRHIFLTLAIAVTLPVYGFSFGGPKFDETKFTNASTNVIWVDSLLYDGKDSGVPCGWLGPNGGASASMDSCKIPQKVSVSYNYQDGPLKSEHFTQELATSNLVASLKSRHISNPVLLFVFSPDQHFTLKYYKERSTAEELDGTLWPDCEDPRFAAYVAVVRSTVAGDVKQLHNLLDAGALSYWPGCPESMSPLEWSVRYENVAAINMLLSKLPADYSPYDFAECIKLAVYSGRTDILTTLFQNKLAQVVPLSSLQEIFYSAVYQRHSTEVVDMLLKQFKVGVDFPIRDVGITMLYTAAQDGDVGMVQWLLDRGANPDISLTIGTTLKSQARGAEVCRLLQAHSKNP